MGFASCSAMAESFKTLLDNGLAMETVLPFMTSNVARLLRLSRKGRIALGGDADLLVVDQDNQIDGVMARGRWQVKNSVQLVNGLFEE